jgi:hypothetical protein
MNNFNRRTFVGLLVLALTACTVASSVAGEVADKPLLIRAARLFDGETFKTDMSVLIEKGRIKEVGTHSAFKDSDTSVLDLGDATLLPGFVELHAHLGFQHIPADVVLEHGITTLRDVGGPVHPPQGGDGRLRVLTSGLILTAPGGYPIPGMGAADIARPVANAEEARQAVREMVEGGAAVIKVALEPGGEHGAPWAGGHGHGHGGGRAHAAPPAASHAGHPGPAQGGYAAHVPAVWPLLPEAVVRAIVDEAHKVRRKVTAHVAEEQGVTIALNAGIDEWAHLPCAPISEPLLKRAVMQQVKIVTTLDTLSKCAGIVQNAQTLAALGADFYYGAEVAHPDIPWGIDVQEMNLMMQWANMSHLDVLKAATSKAGRYLNIPLLGTIRPYAPADLIAVKGELAHSFKALEYPALVISGGHIIVNRFENKP